MKIVPASLLALAGPALAAPVTPYVSPDGYQITPPAGWTTDLKEVAQHDVYFDSPATAEIGVTASVLSPGETLDSELTQVLVLLKRQFPDIRVVSKRCGSVAGERDLDVVATYTTGSMKLPLRLREVLTIHDGMLYSFSLTETQRTFAKTAPLFGKSLQSVRWTKPTGTNG